MKIVQFQRGVSFASIARPQNCFCETDGRRAGMTCSRLSSATQSLAALTAYGLGLNLSVGLVADGSSDRVSCCGFTVFFVDRVMSNTRHQGLFLR